MDVEIRMDKVKTISSVSAGFLQDVRPWIVFPQSMSVQTSKDGKTWKTVGTTKPTVAVTEMTPQLSTLAVTFPPTKAQFVRVIARTFGKLPAWHPGAGNEAFIFCDEIEIR
jgi:hexosaminidase